MEKFKKFFLSKNSTVFLINIALTLAIIYLVAMTNFFWGNILDKAIRISTPFIVGAIIAFLLAPLVRLFTKKMPRSLAILLTIFIVVVVIVLMLIFALPQLYQIGMQFYNEFNSGQDFGIASFFEDTFNFDITPLLSYALATFNNILDDFKDLANLNIPVIINKVISITVTLIFGLAVSLYLLTDKGIIKDGFTSFLDKLNPNSRTYIRAMDKELRQYLKGMFYVMIVRFLEYSLIYYIFRSPYWLVLGLLHAIGIFIPYLGGIIATLLAAVSLIAVHSDNWSLLIFMFIFLVVIQYVNEYYVAPKMLSKTTKVNPLWTIFALFAGSTLYGVIGILVAVPLFMCATVCIKTFYKLRTEKNDLAIENKNENIENKIE